MTYANYYTVTLRGEKIEMINAMAKIIKVHEENANAFHCIHRECSREKQAKETVGFIRTEEFAFIFCNL